MLHPHGLSRVAYDNRISTDVTIDKFCHAAKTRVTWIRDYKVKKVKE